MEERTGQRAYQYEKLRYDDSFGVLPLEPSTDSTAPWRATLQECRLHHDIDPTPDGYEAISYGWGAPLFSEDLMIDGRPKAITPNLFQALTSLRNDDTPRRLRADQVCIDQKVEERGQQVRLMSEIYKAADRALIWLGPRSAETNIAMSSLKRLEEYAKGPGFRFFQYRRRPRSGRVISVSVPGGDIREAAHKIYRMAIDIHLSAIYAQS